MYGLRNSELSTCLFQFSHKTRQTMLLYAYFTPKVDFKCKFNHHQSFLYEWRLTSRTIQKFRMEPSIRIESDVRFKIESNHEASQVPIINASSCQGNKCLGPYSWKVANICRTCDVANHLRCRSHERYDLFTKGVANFATEIARALTFAMSTSVDCWM